MCRDIHVFMYVYTVDNYTQVSTDVVKTSIGSILIIDERQKNISWIDRHKMKIKLKSMVRQY
jgi:hypothetical protein